MQIIKLWLKITAVLALLGWAGHAAFPELSRWTDGVFSMGAASDAHAAKPAKINKQHIPHIIEKPLTIADEMSKAPAPKKAPHATPTFRVNE